MKLLRYLGKKYGKKIMINCGKIHVYLGMDYDYSEEKVVQV